MEFKASQKSKDFFLSYRTHLKSFFKFYIQTPSDIKLPSPPYKLFIINKLAYIGPTAILTFDHIFLSFSLLKYLCFTIDSLLLWKINLGFLVFLPPHQHVILALHFSYLTHKYIIAGHHTWCLKEAFQKICF